MIPKESVRRMPHSPGVYLIKDSSGGILYVGKAVDLRRRLASHLRPQAGSGACAPALAPEAAQVDCIVTDTEKEALLLEDTLIKEHWPRYNVSLKDDSSHAHIRLSVMERFPSLSVTRNVRKDGARYFGPYLSADAARKTIRFLQRLFPLRDCSMAEFGKRKRPCISYQIGRCAGPCAGLMDEAEYAEHVRRAILFLSGKTGSLLEALDAEMRREAEGLNFERARRLRDTIAAIRESLERQKSVSLDEADRDVLGIHRAGAGGEAAILCVRGGKLIGKKTLQWAGEGEDEHAIVREILLRHYLGGVFVPPEILVPAVPEDRSALEELIGGERGGAVRLRAPRAGDARALVAMAAANARAAFMARVERDRDIEGLPMGLQRRFRLPRVPRRIECVDISHTGGAAAVGSLVAFKDGAPYKEGYRHFGIRGESIGDDCAMIYEVLGRRARRSEAGWGVPDLVVVDGGKGQLNAALRALREAGQTETSVLAVAKEREAKGGRVPDRVFVGGRKNPVLLSPGDSVFLFLQRIRDEAHRFALSRHRAKRAKRLIASELDVLAGIGAKRRSALLAALGDARGIAAASLAEIRRIVGSEAVARRVYDYFRAREKRHAGDEG